MSSFWSGFQKQAKLRDTTTLEPHQVRVQQRLQKSPGVLVYHGLGSGKTLTSLAATQKGSTDVVVPAALRQNYAKEVQKHTTGHKPNIMSYEKAVKTEPTGENLVVDEAHMLGSSDSKRSQSLVRKARDYDKRILLTGTPIRNHPHEIAPLLSMVRGDNKVPIDREAFNKIYLRESQTRPGFFARLLHDVEPGVEYNIKNPEHFAKMVKGFVDYHAPDKKNFPSVTRETIQVPMDDEQKKYYDFVLDKAGPAMSYKIKRGLPPSKAESKNLNSFLTGARQVSNSTKSFGGQAVSPKIQRAIQELSTRMEKDPNFKAMIYSNYLGAGVDEYASQLKSRGVPHTLFTGELSDRERKKAVEDYNNGLTKALLISGAGAQGLDLKGTKLVQLLEPHWNTARLDQAEGRGIRYMSHAHLPENERNVHVQKFQSTVPRTFFQKVLRQKPDQGVDEYLDMLSSKKDALNDQFLDILKAEGSKEP